MSCISAVCRGFSKPLCGILLQSATRTFSVCNNITISGAYQNSLTTQNSYRLVSPTSLLTPSSLLITPAAGMKQMGKLRRRCKHCFFIMIDERLHVWCDVHHRHKQMQMIPQPKTVIVTTHATQGKIRPW